jgi:hypothetical protein
MKISVSGKTINIENVQNGSAIKSELDVYSELLAQEVEDITEIRSLPDRLFIDGLSFDTSTERTWVAVGIDESRSWVSDLDVLRIIVLEAEKRLLNPMILSRESFPRLQAALEVLSSRLLEPRYLEAAKSIGELYINERGLMVVDVVASRRRRYDKTVLGVILPTYKEKAQNLSLKFLAENPPSYLPLMNGEAETMAALAQFLISFGSTESDERSIKNFAKASWSSRVRARGLAINGIGPVLFEYLRMLSGADAIKIDSRVRLALRSIGVPQHFFTDVGLVEVCKLIAQEINCSLVQLDQLLWLESDN